MNIHRRSILQASLCLMAGSVVKAVSAQGKWPSQPIRLIVAFAPGGFTDIAARLVGNALSTELGQPIVIENKSGAAGIIGTQAAAQARPDGYTLLLGTISTHAINVGLYKQLAYDPVKQFVPISAVAKGPLVLVAHPDVGVSTTAELIDLAKANPGRLTYGSGGNGTTSHLAAELFKSLTGVDILHVPFRSPSMAATGLLGKQIDIMFDTVPSVLPHVRADKLKAIGVTGDERVSQLPETPSLRDTIPDFTADTWVGLFAPAGTPEEVVRTADAAVHKVLGSEDLSRRLSEIGMQPFVADPAEFSAFIKKDTARWTDLIQKNGISVD